jgi:ATP adenylyltransferase
MQPSQLDSKERTVGYERLWAPWRLAYIQGDQPDQELEQEKLVFSPGADHHCFICQGVASSKERARLVVHRTEHCLALLNRYPYNNGHLLVSPRCHRGRLDQLTDEEHLDLSRTLTPMVGLFEKTLRPEGFNIGLNLGHVAGAGLPGHLHWHIVPRWNGDTNFMPALAAVKVIPQSLDTLWEILTRELASEKTL